MNGKTLSKIIVIISVILFIPITNNVYAVEKNVINVVSESYSNEDIPKQRYIIKDEDDYKSQYSSTEDNNKFESLSGAAAYLRSQMVKRKSSITVELKSSYYKGIIKEIFTEAIKYNKELSSSEGDYLYKHFSRYNCDAQISGDGWITFTYKMEYLTNKNQEDKVDKKVKEALSDLNVYNMNDYDKVKVIHDYIVMNVNYDYSYNKFSAYNAIIDRSVVCQGFASLTYKMLHEAGIEARIITGKSDKGVSHAWNIAYVDNGWYYLDNTWDENLSTKDCNDICYTYFLCGGESFPGHNTDKAYLTEEFCKEYPISKLSYSKAEQGTGFTMGNGDTTKPEDVNKDGIIDEMDLAVMASMYNVDSSSSRWNKDFDINGDNIIDIYDIVALLCKLSI